MPRSWADSRLPSLCGLFWSLDSAGEPAGLLFKHLFLLRLPEDLREQVSKKIERLAARELAKCADTRWYVQNAKHSGGKADAAVGAAEETPTDAPVGVAAVPAPAKG